MAYYNYDLPGYITLSGNSAGRWNAVLARARYFTVSSGSEADVRGTQSDFGSEFDGITYAACKADGYYDSTRTVAYFNTYYGYYDNTRRYSVMVHELGHAFGLGHSGTGLPCSQTGVMHPYTTPRVDNCGIQSPQPDDIAGVNNRY